MNKYLVELKQGKLPLCWLFKKKGWKIPKCLSWLYETKNKKVVICLYPNSEIGIEENK
jgi:hypothetical protein